VIIACNRTHPAPNALRTPDGSATHACALEAMRTQGAFSLFQGVARRSMIDFSVLGNDFAE
jgi:hypothetical protein